MELKNAASSRFGVELPATVTFDYPSIDALAGYIAQQQLAAGGAAQPSLGGEATRHAVLATLLETAASLLGAQVAADQPLMEAGLDSIGEQQECACLSALRSVAVRPAAYPCPCLAGLVEFKNAVQASFGVELPATVTFDYPTPAALASFIAARLAPAQALDVALLDGPALGQALAQHASGTRGSTLTEIVGWAAAVASCGDPDTSEPSRLPITGGPACSRACLRALPPLMAHLTSTSTPLPRPLQPWRSASTAPRTASRLCPWSAGTWSASTLRMIFCRWVGWGWVGGEGQQAGEEGPAYRQCLLPCPPTPAVQHDALCCVDGWRGRV